MSNLDKEQTSLAAVEIISFGQSMREAIRGLRAKGCDETAISFQNDVFGNTYDNTRSPADGSCHAFRVEGAGLSYSPPVSQWLDFGETGRAHYGQWFFTPSSYVAGMGVYGTGGSACVEDNECWELIMGLPYVSRNICIAINRKLGFGGPNGEPPVDTGASFAQSSSIKFQGVYPTIGSEMGAATPTSYSGAHAGCIEGGSNPATGTYHFFQVLLVR